MQPSISEAGVLTLMAEGQFQQALEMALACLEGAPGNAQLCNLGGLCANRLGNVELAESLWVRALALDPEAAQICFNLGALLMNRNADAEAERSFRRVLEIDPGHASACSNLALVLERLQRLDEAEQFHYKAVHLDGGSAEIRFNLANFLSGFSVKETIERARLAFIDVIGIMPTHFGAWINLGNLLFETGYTAAAHTAYSAAVTYHPNEAAAHVNLGNVLLHMDKPDSAETHFSLALSIDPDLPEAHQGMASVHHRQGNKDKANYHRNKGFGDKPVTSLAYRGRGKPVPLLILASSFEGNVPWRLLIDQCLFRTTVIAVECFERWGELPAHRLIFNAIGDADLSHDGLEIAHQFVEKTSLPVINPPKAVLKTGRMENARRLALLPGVITPKVSRITKAALFSDKEMMAQFDFPFLLRSSGFHGGNYFVRVDTHDALIRAADELPGDWLLAMDCLDSRSDDGLFRKFRVMSINGNLYPVQMAISRQWKVHYFSSDMAADVHFRKEEDLFLNDFSSCLGRGAVSSLEMISRALGLDYCGMDFGIDRDGNILLYEANATMSIVPPSHEKVWDYKRISVDNALRAAQGMFVERLTQTDLTCRND